MTDLIFSFIADYGVMTVFCITFLSCLAIPVPSSLVMLAAGGFAAAGDLVLMSVGLASFTGAVLGDNAGYLIARKSGDKLGNWLDKKPSRAALMNRGRGFMTKWGGSSVFFSCWLVAPLGPYINYISGLTKFTWFKFALWGAAGEVVWVTIYVGLGYSFADQITALSSLLGNISGFIAAVFVAGGLGYWLYRASNSKENADDIA